MEFSDGAILAYTESPIYSENHVTVLFSLEKGILSPSRQEPGSFEEVKETAFSGSDYADTGEEVSTFEAIATMILSIGLPIGLIIWFFRMKKKRAEKKGNDSQSGSGISGNFPTAAI